MYRKATYMVSSSPFSVPRQRDSNVPWNAKFYEILGRAVHQLDEVHLRTVLHEDQHLLPVDLHPEVVDEVVVVDRLKDTQLISNIP